MAIDSTEKDTGNSFEYKLREMSDTEIINILRYREHYQSHAAKEAIKEALNRGIISSIEDLEKDEFKALPLPPKSLFPVSLDEERNKALLNSLRRINYLFGGIPIIFGIFQIFKENYISALITILLGLLMIFLVYKLGKEKSILFSQILLFVNIPTIALVIYYVLSKGKPTSLDIFTGAIVVIMIIYSTIYLHKLNVHLSKNSK